ncbi:transmembrane protein 69-like isoform X2 [Gouania willdenowi]|nr:transmembrane protein 69-like isoform X2 [Gouania willdenowi]
MVPILFRRSTFVIQKVWHRAGFPLKCWTSGLTGAFQGGLVSSSARLSSTDSGQLQTQAAAIGFKRTSELLQSFQIPGSSFQHFHSSCVRLKKRAKPEPPPRELDLLRYDMKEIWNSPKPALYLSLAGLVPFVGPTLFMLETEGYYPELAYAQVAYGASILSFLGGARWGFALPESSPAKPDWINLSNSVVPSLLACLAMVMSDHISSAATMIIMGYGIALHYDLALLPTYPGWFKAMRAIFTIVAFLSLLATVIINGNYPEKKLFKD